MILSQDYVPGIIHCKGTNLIGQLIKEGHPAKILDHKLIIHWVPQKEILAKNIFILHFTWNIYEK